MGTEGIFMNETLSQVETLQANNVQLNLKIGAIKANLLRMTSQYNVTNTKLTKTLNDLDEMTTKCDQFQIDLTQQQNILKQKDTEIIRITKDYWQLIKSRDVIRKRIQVLEAEKSELGIEITKLR